jgi:eukaryotic-like serine/threonine-protein kinase
MVGQSIGKYRVLDRIGRGGMGTVYRALDETLHREVAIKVLNAELNDPEVARRFRAEAVTVARLNHPGIATIYELFEFEGQWLMVMEFVRGETLEHMVERMGALSPQRAAELCMQALTALAHAHSLGVVHRDLKPANLMITETGAVKIMDFGIARVSGTEHLTNAGFMMGTPAYMAPEQVLGQEIDARADLYSMGVVFYRLTTGKLPFKGETPFAMAQSQVNDPPTPLGMLRSDLPPWAEQVTTRALAKAREERFQSAVEFYEAFARCLAGLPMNTPYNPSGPTALLMTPPQPMPTGSMMSPAYATGPQLTGTTPHPAPADTPTMMPSSVASGQMAGASATGASRVPTAAQPVPAAAQPAAAPAARPADAAPKRVPTAGAGSRSNGAVLALSAVVVVLAVIVGVLWFRNHQATQQATEVVAQQAPAAGGQPTGEAASPAAGQPGASSTAASGPPPAESTAAAPPRPAAPSPARVTEPPAAAPSRPSAPPPNSPAPRSSEPSRPSGRVAPPSPPAGSESSGAPATGAAGATAARASEGRPVVPNSPADEHVVYSDVKLLTVTSGKKTHDQDALLSFVGGTISVLAKDGGTPIMSMTYKGVVRATFVHARDPKWDPSLPAPADEKLDLPGLFHPAHNWLVLQTKTAYTILRLDDSDVAQILTTVETRTGVKVDRPD